MPDGDRHDRPRGRGASAGVFDASGRLVRTLLEGELLAGQGSLAWDGRDASGRDVPGGVYFVRVTTNRGTVSRSIVVAR